jgi:hypothetical protein
MNSLAIWCDQMQMSYNIDKCHTLHLGSRNLKHQYTLPRMSNINTSSNGCSYDFIFHNLTQVQEEKDLGVTIDHNLGFRKHMSEKISKANSMIFLIKSNFKDWYKQSGESSETCHKTGSWDCITTLWTQTATTTATNTSIQKTQIWPHFHLQNHTANAKPRHQHQLHYLQAQHFNAYTISQQNHQRP